MYSISVLFSTEDTPNTMLILGKYNEKHDKFSKKPNISFFTESILL